MRLNSSIAARAANFSAFVTVSILICRAETSTSPRTHEYVADVAELAAAPAPAPGGILLVGSSIIRKWATHARDLAPLPVTNRGFGGSRTADQLFFFDQIVPSSRASLVVWYCGSNDVNGNKSSEEINRNTKVWIERTQTALPQARILLVSVIRAPQKREEGKLLPVDEVNKGLLALAGSIKGVTYADVNPAMETPAGEAVAECYLPDKLHLTEEGYRRLALVLKPIIEKNWRAARDQSP